ncbi:DUF1772 domain-containing protein [Asanoa iriomotensis]|uniref:DUF1772 domain-containing protein n=1 Tax=Asanoa iriomotensis TaxID=234613 RepID=A0ABQ4C0X7_9ACTN|nr:DUF1772 domain-containing protein [Asanoa iriomotensis]GIF56434.1 hypothetical protein Air01nite_25290 [Asanoa iriomotensis]
MEQGLVPLMLLANGIASGVMVSTVIGLAPMSLAVPYETYVRTIQFLWKRYDPLMPILNALACVLALLLAFTATETVARLLFGAGGVLLLVVMAISVVKNVPINRYVMSLDPGARPADWTAVDPRVRWRNWNLVRTSLALVALGANLTGAGTLL